MLAARGPFRLDAVVVSHGWFQTAPFAWDAAARRLERADLLRTGATRLRIDAAGRGVAVRGDPPLAPGADGAAARRVRRVLQLDADLQVWEEAVRAVDPDLADDLASGGCGRILAGATLYEDVAKAICATNTTWRQAVGSINRLARAGAPGCFPEPADLLRAGEDHLRAVARVGYRASAITFACRAAIDGTLAEIESDSAAGDAERAFRGLLALPGVGPSTAGFILLLMGHYDHPSIDAATMRAASVRWFAGARPRPREVLDRIAPAAPFRGLVVAWSALRAWQREAGLVSEPV